MYVPTRLFLTRGVGRHREKLSSFEMALRSAGIAQFNEVDTLDHAATGNVQTGNDAFG